MTQNVPLAGPGQPAPAAPVAPDRGGTVLREILESSWLVGVLAVVIALILGGLLIAAADQVVQQSATYFFARPGDLFAAVQDAVVGAYVALFQGAVFDTDALTFARSIRPLTETMTVATPLILAGLGLGIGFRAGLFNIGAQGQIILGAIVAGYVGFAFDLPPGLHLLLAALGAALGGAFWAGIAGVLKARTGAHEVIVTIMLNNIAVYLVAYLLTTQAFKRGGSNNPISPPIPDSAQYPLLVGSGFRLHAGFLLALGVAVGVWWLMERSTVVLSQIPVLGPVLFRQTVLVYVMYVVVAVLQVMLFRSRWGLRVRAVGEHPKAADTVGIKVNRTRVRNAVLGGAVAGLGGAFFTVAAGLAFGKEMTGGKGFIALAAMILGRWSPTGALAAALLFGFADNLQVVLGIIGTPIPSQIMLMTPYVVTILAVAGFVGRVRPPAAEGVPYVK